MLSDVCIQSPTIYRPDFSDFNGILQVINAQIQFSEVMPCYVFDITSQYAFELPKGNGVPGHHVGIELQFDAPP